MDPILDDITPCNIGSSNFEWKKELILNGKPKKIERKKHI